MWRFIAGVLVGIASTGGIGYGLGISARDAELDRVRERGRREAVLLVQHARAMHELDKKVERGAAYCAEVSARLDWNIERQLQQSGFAGSSTE